MRNLQLATVAAMATLAALVAPASANDRDQEIQLGPRPYFLVDDMDEGKLKRKLESCASGPFLRTDFSIGHRGAPMQFPEHTRESYEAAARMGAGIIECDVTFTSDRELVCRHSQCDLHTTTDILARPELAAKCSVPFQPANPQSGVPAAVQCCASDITLREFKSLCGKMDAANSEATSIEAYLDGTANWRTDLYASCGTVLAHAEAIELFESLGVKHTPELKSPDVEMPYEGQYTQADYAQAMIDEYVAAGVEPNNVWPQSFNLDDVKYWIDNAPAFGRQAVYLDSRVYKDTDFAPSRRDFRRLRDMGVNIVAPPIFALLKINKAERIAPSRYARLARRSGLDIITWTLERSGPLARLNEINPTSFYYSSIAETIDSDGDVYTALDVLARRVNVLGVFSDWPATTTYYANCMGY